MSHSHANAVANMHPAHDANVHDVYPIGHDSELKKPARKSLYYNRFILPFQSLNFGASSVLFQINNVGLLSNTYLQMTLPASGTVRANSIIGQNIITRIDYILAGSQMVTVSGPDNFLFSLDECEDTQKKNEVIKLAGGDLQGQVISSEQTIYLPLAFPWSHTRAGGKKFPIDLSLFNSPLKIMVYLNQASNLYSANAPSALVAGQMVCKMGELTDASQRLHLGDRVLLYPHAFLQSFTSSAVAPGAGQNATVYLSGYRSGSLCGMLIRSLDVSRINQTDYVFNTLSDVVFRVNGVIVAQFDKENYKLQNLMDSNTACKVTINNTDYYYIHFNFTHNPLKLANFGVQNQSSINMQSQLLQLDFKSSSTNSQVIQALYVYEGFVACGAGNAEIIV